MNVQQEKLNNSLSLLLAKVLGYELVAIEFDSSSTSCKFKTSETISLNEFEKIKKEMDSLIDQKIIFKTEADCFTNSGECSKAFILEKVAQEDLNGKKIQKITFAAFFEQAQLEEYLKQQELLKQNDHRLIGKQMDLFHISQDAVGSIFWLQRGWQLYMNLQSLIRKYGYQDFEEVRTPFVMSKNLWEQSGHMAAFKQNMMFVLMGEEKEFENAIKPMNCPAHIKIFDQKPRSYKQLPLRIAEFGCCHRYEPSGALHGLMRVRSLTIDDGHIFCTKDHIKSETERFLTQAIKIYKMLGFNEVQIIFATRPEKYLGNIADWEYAEEILQQALKELNLDYKIANGDGAFYGPKIEMHVKDSMNRSWQLGTIQLDFVLGERMDISYIDAESNKQRPCILHRAILGSLERFIGVLLEHTGGKLPLYLAPVQIAICTVTDDVNDYANKIYEILRKKGVSLIFESEAGTLAHKLKKYYDQKVPMIIVVGKQEKEDQTLTLQYNTKKETIKLKEIEKIMRYFEIEETN